MKEPVRESYFAIKKPLVTKCSSQQNFNDVGNEPIAEIEVIVLQ